MPTNRFSSALCNQAGRRRQEGRDPCQLAWQVNKSCERVDRTRNSWREWILARKTLSPARQAGRVHRLEMACSRRAVQNVLKAALKKQIISPADLAKEIGNEEWLSAILLTKSIDAPDGNNS